MDIVLILTKHCTDDLRMCAFHGSDDCLIVDLLQSKLLDLVPELLSAIIKGGIDLR